jgi:sugar transferase (PEP-CTERM/EpsH1 system associated)
MQKEPLLFLCHRIPFPPNKGDKIRSFNILKVLAKDYDIHLACFVDDPYDWQYTEHLEALCESSLFVNQNKWVSKIKGLKAFISHSAISIPYYSRRKMQNWVDDKIRQHKIARVFVYSSVMAQYIDMEHASELTTIVDFVDVDSDKWRQYSESKTGIARWVYQREFDKLAEFETKVALLAKHSLFVSPQEAELFKQQIPENVGKRVHGILNGVDTQFFDPNSSGIEKLNEQIDVVFTGAMDYWANVDAVLWFSKEIWPLIRKKYPMATFYIVGGGPSSAVMALNGKHGITVTGRVKDVRPYILQSKVIVAPMQIARGIQNKVLEGMAMAKPVIATTMAIEGIEGRNEHVRITNDPMVFSEHVSNYMGELTNANESREWIMQHLQWHATLADLTSMFESQ